MDVGAFVLGGIFTAVVGLISQEVQSARNHRRELERLPAGKTMDIRLADIEMTRHNLHMTSIAEARRAEGPGDVMRFAGWDIPRPSAGTEAVEYLSAKTVLGFEQTVELLRNVADGQGLSPATLKRLQDLQVDIDEELDRARECVLSGKHVPMISPTELKRIRRERYEPVFRALGVGDRDPGRVP